MSRGKLIVGLAMFSAGFFWPTEDAVSGSGLHLVILWLLLTACHALFDWRSGCKAGSRFRPGLADAGVILLVAGHAISTLTVFHDQADRRSALNLSFEWIGLLIQWFCMRHWASRQNSLRSLLSSLVCCLSLGLAAYGIWQSLVFYPEQSEWYRSRREILDRAQVENHGEIASLASEALRDFQARGIPLEGSGRKLWENRLLSSSEPFATFSLANTLAGVLAVAFVLMIGMTFTRLGTANPRRIRTVILFAATATIMWCLVLTKSRSAWAGAIVGTVLIILQHMRWTGSRRLVMIGIVIFVAACLIFGIAALVGVIDKEVILESPRSLQFRFMYWTASINMLKKYPVYGPGPGHFRNAYLQFRADESSEEIRDPHNLILEAWSSGGLLGLAGMTMLMWSMLRTVFHPSQATPLVSEHEPDHTVRTKRQPDVQMGHSRIVASAITIGLLIHLTWEWITGASAEPDDLPVLLLLVGIPFTSILYVRSSIAFTTSAGIAIMIHLLAAGGFGMPAVMSLLLALIAVSVTDDCEELSSAFGVSGQTDRLLAAKRLVQHPLFMATSVAATAILITYWGLVPVLACRQGIMFGEVAFQQRDFGRAREEFLKAAAADPYSVIPRQRLAELASYRLEELRKTIAPAGTSNLVSDIDADSERTRLQDQLRRRQNEFLDPLQDFVRADRRSAYAIRRQALGLAPLAEMLHDEDLFRQAITLQRRATELYPSSLESWIELVSIGQRFESTFPDREMSMEELIHAGAERALFLDAVNHSWGHSDRFLDEDTVNQLKSAAGKSSGSD
ncbi:MAG: O-antigen ligase family protein [Planctomycetota bacterium]